MKRKLLSLLIVLSLLMCLGIAAHADDSGLSLVTENPQSTMPLSEKTYDRVIDAAGLLSADELSALNNGADSISDKYRCDVLILTVNTLDGKSAEQYADDYFDYNNLGYGSSSDGILLVVSMNERDYHMTTAGYAISAFTDAGLERLEGRFLDRLSRGSYYSAFSAYLSGCEELLEMAANGTPYDVTPQGYEYTPRQKDAGDYLRSGGLAAVFGLLVSGIPMTKLKKEVKNVSEKNQAADYVRPGSFNLSFNHDRFLYSNVTRSARPQQQRSGGGGGSTTHHSSSGVSHGGRGGKF